MDKWQGRTAYMEYPNYSAEMDEIERSGITLELLQRIIRRHQGCMKHMRNLYGRYCAESDKVPVFTREPRFNDTTVTDLEGGLRELEAENTINNRVNNDFFSEIVDIKVGFFSGKAANYTYGDDYLSEEETGGEEAVEEASKALGDFIKRSNLFDVNTETTKFAAICGYAGRLFYIDTEGNERAMAVNPYETIILTRTEMTDPEYGVRYYSYLDLNERENWKVEFYDKSDVSYYEGQLDGLSFMESKPHLFDYCPLQGIPNNRELIGDAEKVLALIDDYDGNYSDNSNDIEGFANAYMVFKNCKVDAETMKTANATGVIGIDVDDPESPYDVSYLTKNIDGTFVNAHLDRAEDNIYRFSKTPNLNDPEFTAASGMALRIKMTGLETKAGMFEAKQLSADTYMFKLLASSFDRKKIPFDPLQCSVKYNRNFPTDFLGEAQAVQALIAAGLPKQIAYKSLSFVDDVGLVMRLIETEKDDIPDLEEDDSDAGLQKKVEMRQGEKPQKTGETGDGKS